MKRQTIRPVGWRRIEHRAAQPTGQQRSERRVEVSAEQSDQLVGYCIMEHLKHEDIKREAI